MVENLGQLAVRRVYLKLMSKSGGVIEWLDGNDILEHAAGSEAYWRSIYNTNGINYRSVCAQSLNPMDMIVSG